MSIFKDDVFSGFYFIVFNIFDVFSLGVDISVFQSIHGRSRGLLG